MNAEVLQSSKARFTVNLHPSRCDDALEGVRDQLGSLLLRWNDGLQGVLLTYNNERILSTQATIHSYFPYMYVEVAADVLLFRPHVDTKLCGRIVKIGADFLGVHVLGVFVAAIGREHIRPDLVFRDQGHWWQSRQTPAHRICEGDQIVFSVRGITTDGGALSLTGSLEDSSTGELGFLRTATPGLGTTPGPGTTQRFLHTPHVPLPARTPVSAALHMPQQQPQQPQQQQQPNSASRAAPATPLPAAAATAQPPRQAPAAIPLTAQPLRDPSRAETEAEQPKKKKKRRREDASTADGGNAPDPGTAEKKPKSTKRRKGDVDSNGGTAIVLLSSDGGHQGSEGVKSGVTAPQGTRKEGAELVREGHGAAVLPNAVTQHAQAKAERQSDSAALPKKQKHKDKRKGKHKQKGIE